MKITVLVDSNTFINRYFYGEPGVSYLIETEDKKILFDTGYSDVFLNNAQKMNISLYDLDALVLSHGHDDHTGGLYSLIQYYKEGYFENISKNKPQLISHPSVFDSKRVEEQEIGLILSKESVGKHFDLQLHDKPLWITDKLVYLGQIPRTNEYENKQPIGVVEADGKTEPDFILDDSALAYKSPEGLVVITGCSHSGISNIIEYAKKVCDETKIVDVIGGFHLLNPEKKQLESTIAYLQEQSPKTLHPCHCVSLTSKIEIAQKVKIEEVGVGLVLEFE
jgi:7,8-dihydropterin-6-yl-methyl-4-(beta-D-ribofuranosyl)aminobenzene 5'-phosphate synthase